MLSIVKVLAEKAICKQIIEPEQKEWFCYGIEKRLTALVIGIPCFLIAIIISDFWGAVAFNISFFLLRRYSNGFHADSFWKCLFFSISCELCILGIIYPLLTPMYILVAIVFSLIVVFFLAPYNHPEFRYTNEELIACRKYSRIWILTLSIVVIGGLSLQISAIPKGISLGCAIASASLCFAYIFNRRKPYGKQENETEHRP